MRLTEYEKKIIKETAENVFGPDNKIYIFGSRTNDNLRGGDIDIYIEINSGKKNIFDLKIMYMVELEKKLGEQKIDVVINNNHNIRKIYQIARETGILL